MSATSLTKNIDQRVSHDNDIHSVLGILGVQTRVYQPSLEIYAPCRQR